MDLSKIKKLHSQLVELKNKAGVIDSKKETRKIQIQIDNLENELKNLVYNSLEEIPEDLDLRLQVTKIVSYDTSEFKDYMIDLILDSNNLENLDIKGELIEYIRDSYYPADYIYDSDVIVAIDDDRYK